MNITFFGKPINQKFILGILILLHIPYLINCLYANPAADDFEYAASALKHGFWNSYVRDYFNWNGRYTDNLFAFASPLLIGSFAAYKSAAFLLFLFHYFSLFYFFKTIFSESIKEIQVHLISLCISLLYIFNAPSLVESFYWYTGAVSYQLPQSLSLIYFALLFRFFCTRNKLLVGILIPLLLIIAGFNEVIMLLMAVFHVVFAVRALQLKHVNVKMAGLLLFFLCIGAAVMVFSPGNAHRAAHFTSDIDQMNSLKMSIFQVFRFLIVWLGQPALIAASVLFVPLSIQLKEIRFFRERFFIHPAITLVALPAIIFLCVFPAYWGTGILGQHRTVNTAYFFFVLIWFMNVHNFVQYLIIVQQKYELLDSVKIRKVMAILFLAGVTITNNGYKVLDDLISGRSQQFEQEMLDRYTILMISKEMNGEDVQLKRLSAKPKTLFVLDITPDPRHWTNGCWQDYFSIKEIRTTP